MEENRSLVSSSGSPASAITLLEEWQAALPVPIDLAAQLPSLLDALERDLAPMSPAQLEAWGARLGRMMIVWKDARDARGAMPFYLDVFRDVPLLLASRALDEALKSCKFAPTPADLRELVSRDMSRLHYLRARARVAMRARREEPRPPPPTPEQVADVRARLVRAGVRLTSQMTPEEIAEAQRRRAAITRGEAERKPLVELPPFKLLEEDDPRGAAHAARPRGGRAGRGRMSEQAARP